jgi:hypothetical protein
MAHSIKSFPALISLVAVLLLSLAPLQWLAMAKSTAAVAGDDPASSNSFWSAFLTKFKADACAVGGAEYCGDDGSTKFLSAAGCGDSDDSTECMRKFSEALQRCDSFPYPLDGPGVDAQALVAGDREALASYVLCRMFAGIAEGRPLVARDGN